MKTYRLILEDGTELDICHPELNDSDNSINEFMDAIEAKFGSDVAGQVDDWFIV